MKIGVGAAVYISNSVHAKLARETIASITSEKHDIEFCFWLNAPVDDSVREILHAAGHIHANEENNVSRGWNRAINCLLEDRCSYVLVPNLDIVIKQGSLDALVDHAEGNPEAVLWTMTPWSFRERLGVNPGLEEAPLNNATNPHPHFSCFMVDDRLFELVGPFDEAFKPAYNEDLDMHWRIQLAGFSAVQYEGARFYHVGSATIRNDKELAAANSITHGQLNAYFIRKWGHKPATANDPFTKDMYRHPFNDPAQEGFERAYRSTW